MLKFNKGFIKNTNTKIATNYNITSDADKIKEIRLKMEGKVNLEHPNNSFQNNNPINQNNQIYLDRINALKNIKKD